MAEVAIRIQRRHLLIGLAGLLLAGALAAGVIWYLKAQDTFGVPRAVRDGAPFPVYYVRNLPEPYSVKPDSYAYREGVLSFVIEGEDGRQILVTEQLPPKNFDIDSYINEELTDQRAAVTAYGKAVIGKRQSSRAASLKTDKTWLMMSAAETVPAEDLAKLIDRVQLQE